MALTGVEPVSLTNRLPGSATLDSVKHCPMSQD